MNTIIANKWTTIVGVIGAIGQYVATQGATPPHDQASWTSFYLGLVIAVLGVLAKDAHS